MAEIGIGTLYELNKQVMNQLPSQSEEELKQQLGIIGAWFGQNLDNTYYMLMCKERSDFTLLHITDHQFTKGIQELKEVLESKGELIAIQYLHGEDTFECWLRIDGEVFLFMFFEADWMVVEV